MKHTAMNDEIAKTVVQAEVDRQLQPIQRDMIDIRESLRRVADALTRLALLEERQATFVQTNSKIVERLETLERKQNDQALAITKFETTKTNLITGISAFWAVIVIAVAVIKDRI